MFVACLALALAVLFSLVYAVGLLPATESLVDLVRPLIGPDRLGKWTSGLASA